LTWFLSTKANSPNTQNLPVPARGLACFSQNELL
jgi:hypothetical protein